MKTENEIRQKLAWLLSQRSNFSDLQQMKLLEADIARLKWSLGEGPDIILVPRVEHVQRGSK